MSENERDQTEGYYDEGAAALRIIRNSSRLDIPELLELARAIQLGSKGDDLPEARAAYLEVLKRDPGSIDALIEMAWFLDVVEDSPEQALRYFRSAEIELQKKFLEVHRGLEHCKGELESGDYEETGQT